jgi:hypothetical protein
VALLVRRVSAELGGRSVDHKFVTDLPPALPAIEADPDVLEDVLRNLSLLGNTLMVLNSLCRFLVVNSVLREPPTEQKGLGTIGVLPEPP